MIESFSFASANVWESIYVICYINYSKSDFVLILLLFFFASKINFMRSFKHIVDYYYVLIDIRAFIWWILAIHAKRLNQLIGWEPISFNQMYKKTSQKITKCDFNVRLLLKYHTSQKNGVQRWLNWWKRIDSKNAMTWLCAIWMVSHTFSLGSNVLKGKLFFR